MTNMICYGSSDRFTTASYPRALGDLCGQRGRSDLRDSANTQRLRRQNFCSRWTWLAELSSGPAAQSRHHLRTVQTTAEGTTFSASMNAALCHF